MSFKIFDPGPRASTDVNTHLTKYTPKQKFYVVFSNNVAAFGKNCQKSRSNFCDLGKILLVNLHVKMKILDVKNSETLYFPLIWMFENPQSRLIQYCIITYICCLDSLKWPYEFFRKSHVRYICLKYYIVSVFICNNVH